MPREPRHAMTRQGAVRVPREDTSCQDSTVVIPRLARQQHRGRARSPRRTPTWALIYMAVGGAALVLLTAMFFARGYMGSLITLLEPAAP